MRLETFNQVLYLLPDCLFRLPLTNKTKLPLANKTKDMWVVLTILHYDRTENGSVYSQG